MHVVCKGQWTYFGCVVYLVCLALLESLWWLAWEKKLGILRDTNTSRDCCAGRRPKTSGAQVHIAPLALLGNGSVLDCDDCFGGAIWKGTAHHVFHSRYSSSIICGLCFERCNVGKGVLLCAISTVVVDNVDILAKPVAFRGVGDIGGFREDEALVSIWIDMASAFLGYFDL